ncbi:MerR family transcriptional regulator [Acidihalobacter prosperus]
MNSTPDSPPNEDALFPIRTVASLTGVNPVTLRAWERRYGLLRPHRTPKGHRLYTRQDIDLIRETLALLKTGVPISQARTRLEERPNEPAQDTPAGPETDVWRRYAEQMLRAVERFDEAALDAAYNEALSLYPVDLVTKRLIQPLLREFGSRWQNREGGVAEEHFFSIYLRNRLGSRLHHLAKRRARPRLAAACLPGEQHETGLLLFCLVAAGHGYGTLILGADTPLEQTAYAARTGGCDAIVLSATTTPPADALKDGLAQLVGTAGMPVMVGGQASVDAQHAIEHSGAIALGDDMYLAAERLRTLLGPAHG